MAGFLATIALLGASCVPPGMVVAKNEDEFYKLKGLEPSKPDPESNKIWLPGYRALFRRITYRVAETIQPPEIPGNVSCGATMDRCMVPIEPADEWRVTHVIGDEYLIQSKTYSKRLCKHISGSSAIANEVLGNCQLAWDFAIAIRPHGTISRGWEPIQDTDLTRFFFHLLGPIDTAGWPSGVVFVPIAK